MATVPHLTAREREVSTLIAKGLSCSEVASRLFIGVSTVKTHLRRAYEKLGVHTRLALERRLVHEGQPNLHQSTATRPVRQPPAGRPH